MNSPIVGKTNRFTKYLFSKNFCQPEFCLVGFSQKSKFLTLYVMYSIIGSSPLVFSTKCTSRSLHGLIAAESATLKYSKNLTPLWNTT